mmetsp:Transcript_1158/g.1631  ORF Transcript_1158/g.1631 Transcript_1158/m.1631 type:complete len:229 (+) Transcript_1158:67-753(+)
MMKQATVFLLAILPFVVSDRALRNHYRRSVENVEAAEDIKSIMFDRQLRTENEEWERELLALSMTDGTEGPPAADPKFSPRVESPPADSDEETPTNAPIPALRSSPVGKGKGGKGAGKAGKKHPMDHERTPECEMGKGCGKGDDDAGKGGKGKGKGLAALRVDEPDSDDSDGSEDSGKAGKGKGDGVPTNDSEDNGKGTKRKGGKGKGDGKGGGKTGRRNRHRALATF